MPLLTSELQRLKFELGFNQLNVGAEPYIGVTRYFEQIVLPNLNAGAITTSATQVLAGAGPTTLTVVSAVGINMFDRIIVDVDDAQEQATVQSVSGNSVVARLFKAHGNSSALAYPVAVEGGESMVRAHLEKCRRVAALIEEFGVRAGIKKADEIEFFGGAGRSRNEPSGFRTLGDMQTYFRSELCKLVFGVGSIQQFGGGGSRIGIY